MRSNFRAMPWGLRITVFAAANCGAGALLWALVLMPPINAFNFSVGRLGMGIVAALLTFGALMLAVTVGLLRRSTWVRPVIVALPVLGMVPFTVVYAVRGQLESVVPDPAWLLSCGVWALLAGAYLFGTQSARRYFRGAEVGG